MKALICSAPGKLEYGLRDDPQPATGRTILKINRIGICGTDLHAFEGTQPYFTYPRILGHELSGTIVDGSDAPGFAVGERVTFIPYFHCGHCIACRQGKPNCCVHMNVCGVHSDGGMVEFLSVPSTSLVHGHGLSDDALALVEPLAIGAHGIRRAAVQPGEFVLVVGAGPIGLGTMEFARLAGARVIALDVNEQRLAFCRSHISVEHTVAAGTPHVLDDLREITRGDMPTVVIDATGSRKAMMDSFSFMAHGARYVLIGLQREDISFSHPEFHKREGTLLSSRNATRDDFVTVIGAMNSGLVKPTTYVTHRAAFDQVGARFMDWLDPAHGVVKAMVEGL